MKFKKNDIVKLVFIDESDIGNKYKLGNEYKIENFAGTVDGYLSWNLIDDYTMYEFQLELVEKDVTNE